MLAVSLTAGRGPLGPDPAGHFNVPMPRGLVYVEPFQRRVRGMKGGRIVVDSERAMLVHRPGSPPEYAFPAHDVDGVVGERAPEVAGYVSVPWDAVESWYEEDEPVFGHPRNPYHRVDCLRASRTLRVELAGVVLVDTTETVAVFETSLAPRLYVHADSVRMDLLETSSTTTYCPYKGKASYWNAAVAGTTVEDAAWSYLDPFPECLLIRGLLSFDEKRVTIDSDLP